MYSIALIFENNSTEISAAAVFDNVQPIDSFVCLTMYVSTNICHSCHTNRAYGFDAPNNPFPELHRFLTC